VKRALLASPLGLVVGLSIGLLGSGGSILAVPALVHVAGQSPSQATATSLLLVAVASLSVLPAHYRAGRVRATTGIVFGLTGIGGSIAGTAVNRRLEPEFLLLAFSALILVAAWRMATGCPSCTRVGEAGGLAAAASPAARAFDWNRVAVFVAAGTGVGFLTGLFGVGGGFLIIPVLTLLLEFAMPQAIGTSLLIVTINSIVALAVRFSTVEIDWSVAAAFTIAAVVGSSSGTWLAARVDARRSLAVFASALVVLGLFTGVTAWRTWSGALLAS
jgi:uncharacterized membrane protein YfcA